MRQTATHRPRLTVDLDAIAANWRALDALGPAETGAAIKADAYGLGADRVGPALAAAGCATFFVATAPEAGALRAALGTEPAIYVLNGAAEGLEAIAAAGAWPVLNTVAEAEAAAARARSGAGPATAALQVETGMARLGADPAALTAAAAAGRLEGLDVRLLMSHLACADAPGDPQNHAQRAAFEAALAALRPRFPTAAASLSATGGALMGRAFAYDLVRPGIGLYGGAPFVEARPVVRLEAPILRVFEVGAGAPSGYGGAWVAARPSRLATIGVGYADGLPRALSNRGAARVGGVEVPFAGRVSMDLIVLDVTDAPTPAVGAPAVLMDAALTVDRIATAAGTIGYEILTSLGRRYERAYAGG